MLTNLVVGISEALSFFMGVLLLVFIGQGLLALEVVVRSLFVVAEVSSLTWP